jgi:hypothetical protein
VAALYGVMCGAERREKVVERMDICRQRTATLSLKYASSGSMQGSNLEYTESGKTQISTFTVSYCLYIPHESANIKVSECSRCCQNGSG